MADGSTSKTGPATARTKTHQAVTGGGSSLRRYQDVIVGTRSMTRTLYFEIAMLFAGVPGALGLLLRQLFWPRLFAACGRGTVFGRGIVLRHPHRIGFGERVVVGDGCVLDARHEDAEEALSIGDDVILANEVILSCKNATAAIGARCGLGVRTSIVASDGNDVRIGADVAIGPHCCIVGGGHYRTERLDVPIWRQGVVTGPPVTLEDDLWLGANVTVLGGVRLGRGSIVAAGAVVNRDVAPYSVCGGVPAKLIKRRDAAGPGVDEGVAPE